MTTLQELSDMLAKAEGPSRRLDGDIAVILGVSPTHATNGAYWERGGFGSADWHLVGRLGASTKTWHAPKFTASIDTALALVERMLPEWRIYHLADERHFQVNHGWVACFDERVAGRTAIGIAPTAPRAVLRALVAVLIDQSTEEALK